MQKWMRFSRNPLERVKLVYTMGYSKPRCIYCARSLVGDFKISSNSSGYVYCKCGYTNLFELVGEFLWEVTVRRT